LPFHVFPLFVRISNSFSFSNFNLFAFRFETLEYLIVAFPFSAVSLFNYLRYCARRTAAREQSATTLSLCGLILSDLPLFLHLRSFFPRTSGMKRGHWGAPHFLPRPRRNWRSFSTVTTLMGVGNHKTHSFLAPTERSG